MTDLSALKELAQKATRGEWFWLHDVVLLDSAEHQSFPAIASCVGEKNAEANSRYIAAASPEVILQLCEVAERAKAAIGWFPGRAAWHTAAPTEAVAALRSALADLEGK